MARDNIFLTYVAVDILFVVSGGLLILFSFTTQAAVVKVPTVENIARNLVFSQCPLQGSSLPRPTTKSNTH